jgi:hypothetical protein
VAVAVFYEAAGAGGGAVDDAAAHLAASKLLAVAAARFEEAFGAALAAMRPRFDQAERSPLTPDELRPFQDFERVADQIHAGH